MQALLKILTLHTFFLSTLMAAGMILANRKKTKNQILFGIFLAFSLIIFYFFLYESDSLNVHPLLSLSWIPGVFSMGPMVYFLAQYSLDKSYHLTWREMPHFIPAILATAAGIIFIRIPGKEELLIYFGFFQNRSLLILGIIGDIIFAVYLLLAARKIIQKYLWNLYALKNEPAALTSMIIFDIFSLAVLTDILSLITGGFFFFQLTILIISVCVLILFILNLVYPNFEKVIEEAVSREKHRKSYLSNVDRDKLKKGLDDLLRKREVFRDEHLSLKKLASMTEVSTHQLSEFINTQYGMNYSVFINEFRVRKAQELLHDKSEYTILAIAYEVGFNSKSAFNDAFHKITGKTPSQFRDHQL